MLPLSLIFGDVAVLSNELFSVQSMDINEELQLVEEAKTNNESFAKLYDIYFPKVYAYTAAKVSSRADAEDLVGDIFMKILENIGSYEARGLPFGAWVFTIARNTLNTYYVKNSKSKHSELEEGRFVVDEEKDPSPKKKAAQEELTDQVRRVLSQLPERDKNVVQLKFFSQLNNREIVQVTGISESNVAVILYRTLKKIKPDLKYFA